VLGTGLGQCANEIKNPISIPYQDIPHFPASTVKFHAGQLVSGQLSGKRVCVMQGRFHYYEGLDIQEVTLPIRVMAELGINTLVVTNAAGSIREHIKPGTIGLITDHINLMGTTPLIGPYDEFYGTRFPDMSEPYSRKLQSLAKQSADELQTELIETIYSAISGPSFETAAEIRMLQIFGADTVGMSVVPEVLVARQRQINVLAFSAITDQSLPERMEALSHKKVAQVADDIAPRLQALILRVLKKL